MGLPRLVFLAAALSVCHAASCAEASSSHRVAFAFHSCFLMNLHHFVFDLAVHPSKLEEALRTEGLTPSDADSLRRAAAFYQERYAQRDLLFDDAMTAIKRALSVEDDRRDPRGLALPDGLAAVLRDAVPVYERLAWPRDDAANRAWIAAVRELDARHGAFVQARIERGLSGEFPLAPVRIDVVGETGKRQGAYTDVQAVIPSRRGSYQGAASLEMLYHEASHVQTADTLEQAIAARLKAAGRPADSELWHALQFYTVGRAVAEALAREGRAYVPYADKIGLFGGYWAPFAPLIERDWQPWLEGRQTLPDTLAHLVERLPDGL
jgi:hypothetical protein